MSFIDDVKSRLSNATPGPWLNGYPNAGKITPMPDHVWSADKELIANAMETRDADFIANAPTDIAKLLELVQVYETALEQVKSVTGTSTLQWHAADKALTAGAKIKGDET